MRPADIARLLLLAALWGASFLFMRIVAPVLGPIVTADLRVLLAGLALLLWMQVAGGGFVWRAHVRPMLTVGLLNSAVPFVLFSFAALTLPAGYSAILNATTPLFGALVAAVWLRDRLTPRKLAGVVAGIAGVGLLVRLGPVEFSPRVLLACAACLGAAICYALASAYIKQLAQPVPPAAMATGSQLAAGLILLPLTPFAAPPAMPTPVVMASLIGLAILCTAFAYLLFYRLVRDIGPAKTLTVTFLIPLFAILWGLLFLGETVTLKMLAGGVMVVLATWLVVGAPAPQQAQAGEKQA